MTDKKASSSATAMKRAYLAMEEMQRRLDAYERARSEPIAIVGAGCRFPGGVGDVEDYWELLRTGTDAVGDIPPDRWDMERLYSEEPGSPGRMSTRSGGFLQGIEKFDHEFFGISHREAVPMDPQQRLLLEVTWEALEHAQVPPDSLAGSATGVFVGLSSSDYSNRVFADLEAVDLHSGTGNSHSVAGGRLSYLLDLRGPSVSVDTACSSSLVTVHQACQSLRLGECDLALAGGVNALLSPHVHIAFSQLPEMLSADGRCKTFDAGANGFIRSEGCGVVVLKRLSDAVRDGDRVLAVVRGSAVNQDGRSSGLTAPNGAAQRAVLEQAVRAAGIEPGQVAYVETHGTGTKLGDPIEVEALADVYGRAEGPTLYLGAAKTNLGHLEAASGMAGLIKAALCVDRGLIPPNLHFTRLNPHIDLDGTRLAVPTGPTPWPEQEGRRTAGVSSFGFSGTNAHVIVEQVPDRPAPAQEEPARPRCVLSLSAKSESALLKLARRYQERLTGSGPEEAAAVCHGANTGRSHLPYRLTAVGSGADELAERLADHVRGDIVNGLVHGDAGAGPARDDVVFLFTGQGSQRAGMAGELYRTQPTFRRTLDQCAEILRGVLDIPLQRILWPDDPSSGLLDDIEYAQPALFALEYSLATLWRSWGVEPAAVAGHSLGEYAAACFSGVMSLEEGLWLTAERARLLKRLSDDGAMAAVFAPESVVAEVLGGFEPSQVAIASVNGPSNVTVSGHADAVSAVCAAFQERRVFAEQLRISTSSHSPLVEPVLEPLRRLLEKVTFSPPRIPLVTSTTGQLLPWDTAPDAEHWLRHTRGAVLFERSVRTLYDMGHRTFLEVGPAPVLLGLVREIVPRDDKTVLTLPSLRASAEDWDTLLDSVGRLHVRGGDIDWVAFDQHWSFPRVELPSYPFDGVRCWIESPAPVAADPVGPGAAHSGRPERGHAGHRRDGGRTGGGSGRGTANGNPAGRSATGGRPRQARPDSLLPTAQELLDLPEQKRAEVLLSRLLDTVRTVMGKRSSTSLGPDRPLPQLGLDSLMAVELRNEIQARLGVSVTVADFLKGATVRSLAEHILAHLPGSATGSSGPAGDGSGDTAIRRVARTGDSGDVSGAISDDVLAELLDQVEGEER